MRAAVAAMTVATAVVVGGCGSSDGLVTIDRVGRADAPKQLDLQLNVSYSPQAPEAAAAKGFTRLYTQWAQRHPEWRLNLNIIGGSQTTTEQPRLLEKAKVGKAPDCANVDSFTIPLFTQQGVLKPLEKYFPQAQRDGLLPYVKDVVIKDGHLNAWWFATDARVLYRRTDLVPQAPRTWDELLAAAKKAKEQDPKVDGYLFNGGRWEATVFDNLGYFWSQGGKLLDDDGAPVFANAENAPKLTNVFTFLQKAVREGVTPSRVTTFQTYDELSTAAQADSVAMFLGGTFQWSTLQEQLSKEQLAKWKVSALPGRTAGETKTGTGGWALAAFSDDEEKVAACASIMREIYTGPGNSVTGELPTSSALFDSLKAFQAPIYKQFRGLLQDGEARPGFAIYPTLSSELQIATGRVLTGSATPQQAVQQAGERVQQTYDLLSGTG